MPGGRSIALPWNEQNGQCAICRLFRAGDDVFDFKASSDFIAFAPLAVQMSPNKLTGSLAAESAWEIDGARDANRTAKHASHAVNRRMRPWEIIRRF